MLYIYYISIAIQTQYRGNTKISEAGGGGLNIEKENKYKDGW
jgi:hypothetical protein